MNQFYHEDDPSQLNFEIRGPSSAKAEVPEQNLTLEVNYAHEISKKIYSYLEIIAMDNFQDMKDALNWPNDTTIRKVKKDFATLGEVVSFTFPSNIFQKSPSAFLIEISVHEEITDQKMAKLQNFKATNLEKKKVLLTIESTSELSLSLIYWKTDSMRKFCCLKLFIPRLEDVRMFVVDEIKKWISRGHNGLSSNVKQSSNPITYVDLVSFKCMRGYNFLMLAAEAGNLQIVQKFINLGFPVNFKAPDGKSAADLAWENRHQSTLLALLKADSMYPQNFDQDDHNSELDYNLNNFITEVMQLFRHIHENKKKEVEKFTNKHPQLRLIYNYANLSAAAFAIAIKKFDIYKILLERNIVLPSNEDIKFITEEFEKSELEALKRVYEECAQEKSNGHIKLLTLFTKISHDDRNFHERMKIVEEAYQELDKIEQISPLLKYVAECRDFIIYFDFNREWTYYMDVIEHEDAYHRIYFAAKGLLDPSMKNGNLGAIAHEICHFVSQDIFKNHAKPYDKKDSEREKFFTNLSAEYKKKENLHEIIASIFSHYPERLYHQEWIVRAPHLMAFYQDDSGSLLACFEEYLEMFGFYSKIFLPKVKESTATVERALSKNEEAKELLKHDEETPKPHPMHALKIEKINNNKEELNANLTGIDLILNHSKVKDRKIVIVSIIGEHRKGKSFFLDYCLRFMYANYPSISKSNKPITTSNWMGDGNESLSGFSWKHGSTADTKGIIFWSDVFLYDDPSGEKVAILLMDTQGLFEPKSTFKENARIFSLSLLVSSVQILNIQGVIQENIIEYLEMAANLTKLLSKNGNEGYQWKPFQRFLFLNRDWSDDEIGFGYEGGERYLKSFLESEDFGEDESSNTKAEEVRENIESSFESIKCFLLNHPGLGALKSSFKGEWSKLEQDFVERLKELIESLLMPENLVKKCVLGNVVTADEFRDFICSYFEAFAKLEIPDHKNIVEILVENQMKLIVKQQLKVYQESMDTGIDFNQTNFQMYMNTKHERAKALAINGFHELDKSSNMKATLKLLDNLEDEMEVYFMIWQRKTIQAYKSFKFKAILKLTLQSIGTFGMIGLAVGVIAFFLTKN